MPGVPRRCEWCGRFVPRDAEETIRIWADGSTHGQLLCADCSGSCRPAPRFRPVKEVLVSSDLL